MHKIKIAVLASGRGSNFQAIINSVKAGQINAELKLLITDNPNAQAVERAKKAGIATEIIDKKIVSDKELFDEKILEILRKNSIELVVLAGYMRIIRSKKLLDAYKYKIINIHPSLLPAFAGGMHAQQDAFDYGVKISGLTIHFVTSDVDHGPIIYQEAVDISDCKSADEVAEKILKIEHQAYKKIVNSFSLGKYIVEGKKVRYEKF